MKVVSHISFNNMSVGVQNRSKILKNGRKREKTPENTKNHTFLTLWVIVTPEIVKFILGLMKLAQPYFITYFDIGVQKCSKLLKMAQKGEKTPENTKHHTFLTF
jgi:hypothetical protein